MPGRKDEGVSEVISFVLILAMLIIAFSLWALYAVPAGGEQMEEVHNVNIQLQFSDLKTGIENVWLSNSTGVIRESVLMLGPDISESGLEILSFPLTRASGTLRIEADVSNQTLSGGVSYSPLVIRYVSANAYVEDMDLLYWGGDGKRGDVLQSDRSSKSPRDGSYEYGGSDSFRTGACGCGVPDGEDVCCDGFFLACV